MHETTEKTDGRPDKLRLTCDTMLGKLCRELRRLGVDTEYRRGAGGIRGYKKARSQGRVFLTRANRLKELPDIFFVESNDPSAQLVQVREKFGIPAAPEGAQPDKGASTGQAAGGKDKPSPVSGADVSRCFECNEALEKVSRDQARPSIPFFIYQIHHDFSRCPKCRRVFWPGSHTRDAARVAAANQRPERNPPGGRRSPARQDRSRRSSNQAGGGEPRPAKRRSRQHGGSS